MTTLSQLKELSNEELRVRVAELMGWEISDPPEYEDGALMGHIRPTQNDWRCWDMVPEYATSLDCISEAEKTLSLEEWRPYVDALWKLIEIPRADLGEIWFMKAGYFVMLHASARSRAIAFVFVKQAK